MNERKAARPSQVSWTSTCGREVFETEGPGPCPGCGLTLAQEMNGSAPTLAQPRILSARMAVAPTDETPTAVETRPMFVGNFFKKAAYGAVAGAVAVVSLGLHSAASAPVPPELAHSPVVAILWPAVVVGGLTGAAATLKRLAGKLWTSAQ